MGYSHTNSKGNTYYLHSKDVQLKGGRNQTIYYFAKDSRPNACDLPAGKQVVESPKTGLPFVKGKQLTYFFFVTYIICLKFWHDACLYFKKQNYKQ